MKSFRHVRFSATWDGRYFFFCRAGLFRKFTGGGDSSGIGDSLLKVRLERLLSGNSTRPARELSPESSAAVYIGGVSSGGGGDSFRIGERSRKLSSGNRNSPAV